jgi:hypothetical protein
VKDALPESSRAKWEKGLKLGYSHIVNSCKGKGTHNITALNASGLYLAGVLFDNKDWRDTAQNFMHRVCAKQTADGFWSEHYGPVVIYNTYYLEALGLYYSYSKDPVVLEALKRGAKFHSALLWQDGTSVSIIDERNAYAATRRSGNVGFTYTPEGRQYLLQQMGRHMRSNTAVSGDYAAAMLWNGGQGVAAPPPASGSRYDSHDKMFSVVHSGPYQWVLSSYCCPAYPVRWIMDRQTHVEIAIDGIGVIGSGGNTKMQPYFSTFTFGDPASFQPDYKNTDPDFINKTQLKYLPDSAKINGSTVELTYGKNHCSIASFPELKDRVVLISGFSKAFAMTGWRIGYMCAPTDIINGALKIHQYATMCAPIFSQYASLEALEQGQLDDFAVVQEMRQEYDRRRNYVYKSFNEMGLKCFEPTGSFYVFPSVESLGMTGEEFATKLLEKANVAVVPGGAFGKFGEKHIRCSYAYSMKELVEAIERIKTFVKEIKN